MTAPSWHAHRPDRAWTCDPSSPDAVAFHRSLDGYSPTPLVDLTALAAELGVARVLVKDESQRLGLPAFKALGASWALHRALQERSGADGAACGGHEPVTVVAATDGNHGRAVARFAVRLGHRARIVLPDGVSPAAAQAIRDEGADVLVTGGTYDHAVTTAARLAEDEGGLLVQDTSWDGYTDIPGWIVEGYTTLFAEIDQELAGRGLPEPSLVVVPTGVGSLLQAALAHYRAAHRDAATAGRPRTAVLAAEAAAAACLAPSLLAGRPVTVDTRLTVMAGLNCGTPSALAWAYVRDGLDAVAAVTDDDAVRAARDLASLGVPAGPCGAASLAAARMALTGPGCAERRAHLGVDASSTIVLVSTEGADANPIPDDAAGPFLPTVRVDRERLWSNLMRLKEIGGYDDAATGLRGVRRLALTDEDAEARRLVVEWMREAGLAVRVDRIGNVYARREGTEPDLPCVLMGSHIDTVATGGAFDGTLGVLGAIEVVRALHAAGITTRRSIEVGFFTEEEGARFGTDMLGSAVTAGRISLDHAHALTDAAGATVADELVRIGFDGPEPEIRPVPHAYIECHIQQGPILAAAGVDVGIVTGVQTISWQRLTFEGAAAHAGTTPIEARQDAGLAAAEVVVEIRRMCDGGTFGALRGTVGTLTLDPGQTNVIPARAVLTVDLRNPDDEQMAAAEEHLVAFVDGLRARHGVTATWERMARTAVVPFDAGIQDVVAAAADRLGLPYVSAMSGAGHDAQEIAATCPTAMVFVAGEHGGISHTPREYSRPDACGNGIDVLANAILALAR